MKLGKESSVSTLRNIGESRHRAFNKVGVETLSELIRYYPRAYQNRGNTHTLSEIKELVGKGISGPFSAILTVGSVPRAHLIRRGLTLLKFRVFDDDGSCEVTFFNQGFLKDAFAVGASFRFWGRFALSHGALSLASPLYEPCVDGAELDPITPVYPLTSGLSQKIVHTAVSDALHAVLPSLQEYLPSETLEAESLPTLAYAIKNIHFPESTEALEKAKRRLVFDELFLASCSLGMLGQKQRTSSRAVMKNTDIRAFRAALPYRLTSAQDVALSQIVNDMKSQYAMNRMLTGDVGSGKTAVAAGAAYICLQNSYDCLFMVPTEILAVQHYNDLSSLFSHLGYNVLLLTGSTPAAERRKVISALSADNPTLVIGTHALLSDDIVTHKLGLVIIDEQHRFGAVQRATLAEKSAGVSTLTMSATPIPRSLSLVMYGTLDVSSINELPAGRQPVDTFVVNENYRERLEMFIKKQIDAGHQVYIVCPAIDEPIEKEKKESDSLEEAADIVLFDEEIHEEEPPLKAAAVYVEQLKNRLPMLNATLLHGKMKQNDREKIMAQFSRGEIDVLVSTTVIEVGVNVPNATLMIVENAERFGLSQLHQLRGRVGRGSAKSYFVLVSDAKGERARERLKTIKNCRNGFDIAMADLSQRGAGDLFSESGIVRQHGASSLLLASACRDCDLINSATASASALLASDPLLEREDHESLRRECERFAGEKQSYMN